MLLLIHFLISAIVIIRVDRYLKPSVNIYIIHSLKYFIRHHRIRISIVIIIMPKLNLCTDAFILYSSNYCHVKKDCK